MVTSHTLGFPRIGSNRELKRALESYWAGKTNEEALQKVARDVRHNAWQWQKEAGLDVITVGDFSLYDHILDFSLTMGIVPPRHAALTTESESALDVQFLMARGRTAAGIESTACELTKWFDTNYHYIVPELYPDTIAQLDATTLLSQVTEAQAFGKVKAVIPGLITWLRLSKAKGELKDRLQLLPKLKVVYQQLIHELATAGVTVIQIDEPCLVEDLPQNWRDSVHSLYQELDFFGMTSLLASYFESPNGALTDYFALPFDGFHIDLVHSNISLSDIANQLPDNKFLSAGIVSGRNIWKTDLNAALKALQVFDQNRLWIAPSCSLLHVPYDLSTETQLDTELVSWLAFAKQKLHEITILVQTLNGNLNDVSDVLKDNADAIANRRTSPRVTHPEVTHALTTITPNDMRRSSSYTARKVLQQKVLNLPSFPTTSIGSFPQTPAIRTARSDFKKGNMDAETYQSQMQQEIAHAIRIQEEINLDVLVHGEAERNDMVEYFGEQLEGFAFTSNGWVQSYGSRCVKPPIIFGDISRPHTMTVDWIRYAQQQTSKHVKGMLTGPVTILQWSFVRDDQPRDITCRQIALAILAEVQDLERAGIKVIQVDEPALREGLPLKKSNRKAYLTWAGDAFRLATSNVMDATQIHTHMCYCEFNDIIDDIIALDADVISIETSRSHMELLDVFQDHQYPNEIGLGVYDIHSPRVPSVEEIVHFLERAATRIEPEKIWVNPDCGLKTRAWQETKEALTNMVQAAKIIRQRQQTQTTVA